MAGEPIEDAARRWAAEDDLLAGLELIARAPATGPTTADLHDYYRVKDALQTRPFDLDRFAGELAAFLATAGISPEEFASAVESTS